MDTDEIDFEALLEYRTLLLRRSPQRSRPPSAYRLVWAGDSYEVWQRPEEPEGLVPRHLPLGSGSDPAAVPDCSEVRGLGLLPLLDEAASSVRMIAARHAPAHEATDGSLELPRPAPYTAWLGGSVRGSVELFVDGEEVGEARHVLNNEGGFVRLGEVRLDAGAHSVELRFGGADLHPGSGGFPRPETGPLLFSPAGEEAGELVTVPLEEAESLCGQRWDWIEAEGRF